MVDMRTEEKESEATQRFQIDVLRETTGRDPTILYTKSKSEAHQKPASMPNSQISGLSNLFSGWALCRGGPGPRPSFHWSPTMPLCWPLYICWLAPNTKASRHPILLAWFKEEKKALLLPWVIPGQASQERPVGGSCSKGASCSQLEVPQPQVHIHTSAKAWVCHGSASTPGGPPGPAWLKQSVVMDWFKEKGNPKCVSEYLNVSLSLSSYMFTAQNTLLPLHSFANSFSSF